MTKLNPSMIAHHANCTPDYPEKTADELPQAVSVEMLEDGFLVMTCVDCGAFITDLPPEDDPYWDDVLTPGIRESGNQGTRTPIGYDRQIESTDDTTR